MDAENTNQSAEGADDREAAKPIDLDALKEQARAIVAKGEDVRDRLAGLVADAIRRAQATGQGALDLIRTVIEGATSAAGQVVDAKPEGALKQVTEAVGDGLSQAALSARLALEEAKARGQKFTGEDLKQVADNLESVRSLFAQSVADGGKAISGYLSGQVGDLTGHAERVLERIRPSVEAALQAAREHPVELGKDSIAAGTAAARDAAGSLFSAMGRMLQQAGETIKTERRGQDQKPSAPDEIDS